MTNSKTSQVWDGPIPPYFWPAPAYDLDYNFILAAKSGNLALVEQLVPLASATARARAVIQAVTGLQRTKSVAVVSIIRRHSLDLAVLNQALHQAIVYGYTDCIRRLREIGASIYRCNLTQAILKRQQQIFTRSQSSLWTALMT